MMVPRRADEQDCRGLRTILRLGELAGKNKTVLFVPFLHVNYSKSPPNLCCIHQSLELHLETVQFHEPRYRGRQNKVLCFFQRFQL